MVEEAAIDEATAVEDRSFSLNLRKRDCDSKSASLVPRVGQVHAMSQSGVEAILRQNFPVRVGRSPIHNWGLFTTKPVAKDGIVIEYMGQALRNSTADKKEKIYENGAFKGQARALVGWAGIVPPP